MQKQKAGPTDNSITPHLWVTDHSAYLLSYANYRVKDRELAYDLVQDTFLAALSGIKRFEGRCTERTWLTSILRNKIMDVFREKKRSVFVTLDLANVFYELIDPESGRWIRSDISKHAIIDDSDTLLVKDLEKLIRLWQNKLPGQWSSVFERKFVNDEQTRTICTELNITPSNFWVIMHRTRCDLRACLARNW